MRPGINHLALTVETRDELDRVRTGAAAHGWQEMYADRYPHAGGEQHVALYAESSEGFEVEVVVVVVRLTARRVVAADAAAGLGWPVAQLNLGRHA